MHKKRVDPIKMESPCRYLFIQTMVLFFVTLVDSFHDDETKHCQSSSLSFKRTSPSHHPDLAWFQHCDMRHSIKYILEYIYLVTSQHQRIDDNTYRKKTDNALRL